VVALVYGRKKKGSKGAILLVILSSVGLALQRIEIKKRSFLATAFVLR
jgi:hypothetical protein